MIAVSIAVALALPAAAQADPGDDAGAWLRILDGRLAPVHDFEALSFRFRPLLAAKDPGVAPLQAPFFVRYRWRKAVGDVVDWVDLEGRAIPGLAALPSIESPAVAAALERDLGVRAQEFAARIRGRTLSAEFEGWVGSVERRPLAEREAISLRWEAREPKRVREVTIELGRDGLPWRKRRTFVNGDVLEGIESYEDRDGRYVLSTVHLTVRPAGGVRRGQSSSVVLGWQIVRGVRVLSSIEARGRDLPAHEAGKIDFLDLAIDADVPAFELPPPAPR